MPDDAAGAVRRTLDDEPARDVGTCAACGQRTALRESPSTPYPPLPVWHEVKTPGRFDDVAVTCDGWVRVCREWQDYILADPARDAAHTAAFNEWIASRRSGLPEPVHVPELSAQLDLFGGVA